MPTFLGAPTQGARQSAQSTYLDLGQKRQQGLALMELEEREKIQQRTARNAFFAGLREERKARKNPATAGGGPLGGALGSFFLGDLGEIAGTYIGEEISPASPGYQSPYNQNSNYGQNPVFQATTQKPANTPVTPNPEMRPLGWQPSLTTGVY